LCFVRLLPAGPVIAIFTFAATDASGWPCTVVLRFGHPLASGWPCNRNFSWQDCFRLSLENETQSKRRVLNDTFRTAIKKAQEALEKLIFSCETRALATIIATEATTCARSLLSARKRLS